MMKDDPTATGVAASALAATAALAHLNLSQEELEAALPDFERMLSYFAAMRAADQDLAAFGGLKVEDLEPTTHAFSAGNRLRTDQNNPSNLANAILDGAAAREDRFHVLPNVL